MKHHHSRLARPGPDDREQAEVDALSGFVHACVAREHNLEDIDVRIQRDALVVFTGVSGSGKSSLAFGTLYAGARRRGRPALVASSRRTSSAHRPLSRM